VLSSSISCLTLELTGLEGPISTRTALCCPRSNSPTLEDLNSIPLVVRLNGRFFSVPVQPSLTSDLSDLPSSILASLQPSREPLTGGAPWLRFHGCPVSHCSSAQPIRPLRPSEAPKTWAELRTLNLVSGFVEVRMPCRGGADQPPPDSSQADHLSVLATCVHDRDWDELESAVATLRSGAVPAAGISREKALLAKALIAPVDIGQLEVLNSCPSHHYALHISPARTLAWAMLLKSVPPSPLLPPSWITEGSRGGWVAVRLNNLTMSDLLPPTYAARGFTQQREDILASLRRRLLLAEQTLQISRLEKVDQSVIDLIMSRTSVRFDPSTSRHLSVTTILPAGSVTTDFLCGTKRLTDSSYVTLNSSGLFVEIPLSATDSNILKTLAVAMRAPEEAFRHGLASAFSVAFYDTFVQVRLSTDQASKPKPVFFYPFSAESVIVVGVDLNALLEFRRRNAILHLRLGMGACTPVVVRMDPPTVPVSVLYGIIKATPDPLRVHLCDNSAADITSSTLVIGPLPRGWLSRFAPNRDNSKETTAILDITSAVRELIRSANPVFVGRPGDTPFALAVSCSNLTIAHQVIAHYSASGLTHLIQEAFGLCLNFIFELSVPVDCLVLIGEKGLRAALAKSGAVGPDNPSFSPPPLPPDA